MVKTEAKFPNRIREVRKRRGLSLEQLEEVTGISTSYLSRMEAGKRNVSVKNLELIAKALHTQPAQLLVTPHHGRPYADEWQPEDGTEGGNVFYGDHRATERSLREAEQDLRDNGLPALPMANGEIGEPVRFPRRRLPVYGLAVAGDDGRFELNGQRIADVLCPPGLENVRDAYAVYVHGSSMEPRYYPGETVWVHPHKPVSRGDFVVAQIRNDEPGDPPLGFVKQFISRNSKELLLEQFNPPEGQDRIMRFPADRVISVHKIVLSGQS